MEDFKIENLHPNVNTLENKVRWQGEHKRAVQLDFYCNPFKTECYIKGSEKDMNTLQWLLLPIGVFIYDNELEIKQAR